MLWVGHKGHGTPVERSLVVAPPVLFDSSCAGRRPRSHGASFLIRPSSIAALPHRPQQHRVPMKVEKPALAPLLQNDTPGRGGQKIPRFRHGRSWSRGKALKTQAIEQFFPSGRPLCAASPVASEPGMSRAAAGAMTHRPKNMCFWDAFSEPRLGE